MEEGSFDLVLTDIHMPGMDGIEATQSDPRSTKPRPDARAHAHRGADRRCAGNRHAGLPGGRHGWFSHQADRTHPAGRNVLSLLPRTTRPRITPLHERAARCARNALSPLICSRAMLVDAGARLFVGLAVPSGRQHASAIGCATKAPRFRRSGFCPGSALPIR